MNYETLKTRQRAERHQHHPNLALRVHRALSWLRRAEQMASGGDEDGRFIFLWIALNAAYATEIDERYRLSEQATFRAFLQKLADLDAARGTPTTARYRRTRGRPASQPPTRRLMPPWGSAIR